MVTKKPILIVMMLLALFACTKPEEQESPTPDDSETITDPADPNDDGNDPSPTESTSRIGSIEISLFGESAYTLTYRYGDPDKPNGGRLLGNSYPTGIRKMVNFGEVTPDGLKATFSDDVIRTISLSRSGNILSYQGSWREALAIPLQLDDNGKPASQMTTRTFTTKEYSGTRTCMKTFTYRGGNLTKMKVESGTVAEFTTTTTTGKTTLNYEFEYSDIDDEFNLGALFTDISLSDFVIWFVKGFPANAKLPSRKTVSDDFITLREEEYSYRKDADGRVAIIDRKVKYGNVTIGEYIYSIIYK